MSPEKEEVRQKIVLAAIECIEREGIDAITSRSIAREAGVNVAAINYYFGSKANLINAVYKQTLKEAYINNIREFFPEGHKTGGRDFLAFFSHTFTGMLNYPGITKAHLYEPFAHNYYDEDFTRGFLDFLKDLARLLSEMSPEIPEEEIRMNVVQLLSAVFLPGFMPKLFEEFLGFEFRDQEKQGEYLRHLLVKYMGRNRI